MELPKTTTFLAEIFNVQGRCLQCKIFEFQRAFSTRATNRFGTTIQHNVLQRGIGTFHVCVRPDAHITRKATKTTNAKPNVTGHVTGHAMGNVMGHVMGDVMDML